MGIMFDAEALIDGRRSAILAPASISDGARLEPDRGWTHIDGIALGTAVYQVNHFGRHQTTVGTVMSMESIETRQSYELIVTSIHLTRASVLTPDELAELGHADRASFDAGLGGSMGERRVWFIRVLPVSAAPPM